MELVSSKPEDGLNAISTNVDAGFSIGSSDDVVTASCAFVVYVWSGDVVKSGLYCKGQTMLGYFSATS